MPGRNRLRLGMLKKDEKGKDEKELLSVWKNIKL